MVALTCREILNELRKLGLNSISERKTCFREYVAYYVLQYLQIEPVREEIAREHINKLQKDFRIKIDKHKITGKNFQSRKCPV